MNKTITHSTIMDSFNPYAERFEAPLILPNPKKCSCGVMHFSAVGVKCKKGFFYFTCDNCKSTMMYITRAGAMARDVVNDYPQRKNKEK